MKIINSVLVFVSLVFTSLPSMAATYTVGAENFHPWTANRTRSCGGWGQFCSISGGSGYMVASIDLPQNGNIQVYGITCYYRDNDSSRDLTFYYRSNTGTATGRAVSHASPSVRTSGRSSSVRSVTLNTIGHSYREGSSYKIFVYFPEASTNLRVYNCALDVYDLSGTY